MKLVPLDATSTQAAVVVRVEAGDDSPYLVNGDSRIYTRRGSETDPSGPKPIEDRSELNRLFDRAVRTEKIAQERFARSDFARSLPYEVDFLRKNELDGKPDERIVMMVAFSPRSLDEDLVSHLFEEVGKEEWGRFGVSSRSFRHRTPEHKYGQRHRRFHLGETQNYNFHDLSWAVHADGFMEWSQVIAVAKIDEAIQPCIRNAFQAAHYVLTDRGTSFLGNVDLQVGVRTGHRRLHYVLVTRQRVPVDDLIDKTHHKRLIEDIWFELLRGVREVNLLR